MFVHLLYSKKVCIWVLIGCTGAGNVLHSLWVLAVLKGTGSQRLFDWIFWELLKLKKDTAWKKCKLWNRKTKTGAFMNNIMQIYNRNQKWLLFIWLIYVTIKSLLLQYIDVNVVFTVHVWCIWMSVMCDLMLVIRYTEQNRTAENWDVIRSLSYKTYTENMGQFNSRLPWHPSL